MTRWTRRLAPIVLACTLSLGTPPAPAPAQEEPVGAPKSEGRPFDGYFATGCLAGLALYIVGKSARR
jgi:hypothetical protein